MTTSREQWQDTRAFKRGAAIGALVLTSFGAAWAVVALANRPSTPAWLFGVFTLPVLAVLVAFVRRMAAIARSPQPVATAAATQESARHGRRIGRVFATVLGIEIAAIAAAAWILAATGRPLLVPVAVVAIVGAHFFPLARVFRITTYGYAGGVLVACAAGSFLISDEPTRVFWLGLATALVLWTSAAVVLKTST